MDLRNRLRADPLEFPNDLGELFDVLIASTQNDDIQIGERLDFQILQPRHVGHDGRIESIRHRHSTVCPSRPARLLLEQVVHQPHATDGTGNVGLISIGSLARCAAAEGPVEEDRPR